MRTVMTLALLLAVSSSAFAQSEGGTNPLRGPRQSREAAETGLPRQSRQAAEAGCWPVTSRDRVVVQTDDGPARTGTLLCMGPEEIMLTGSGPLPLSTIRQISKPRDSYVDGMLKGAAVGLVFLVFCAPDCPGEYVMRATLGYATLGGIVDALQGNNKTIYRREPKAAVRLTLRF